MSKVKYIGYAYPTSPIAASRGASKTGCYYLAVFDEKKAMTEHDVIYSAINKADVVAMVDHLVDAAIPYNMYSMHKDDVV